MKKLIAVLLAMLLMCSFAFAEVVGLNNFKTTDMDGNTVTQEIFAGYDITMVNVWATWCGYCVEEMPELARLKTMLPENMNIITICDDASFEPELTRQILSDSGANFVTLAANESMYDGQLLGQVYAFPTTFFVDSNGMPITEPLVGVPALENAGDAYYEIMMYIMEMISK